MAKSIKIQDQIKEKQIFNLDGFDEVFELKKSTELVDSAKTVRNDFNLARLPFFNMSHKKEDRFKAIKVSYNINVNDKCFKASWIVNPHPDLGLPGAFDLDVWYGILEIVDEQTNCGLNPVPKIIELGSFYSFLKRIGKSNRGINISSLKEALDRLVSTTCIAKGSFNVPSNGGYIESIQALHLLDNAEIKGESDNKGGAYETTKIKLGEWIKQNLDARYTSLVDIKFIRELKGDLTKLLYPYLSYRLWLCKQQNKEQLELSWMELSKYLTGGGWTSRRRVKEKLELAWQEMKDYKYIDSSSDWVGDNYMVKPDERFKQETQARGANKLKYEQVLKDKKKLEDKALIKKQKEEEKKQKLNQAITLALIDKEKEINYTQLAKYGWTQNDVMQGVKKNIEFNQAYRKKQGF